MHYTTLNRIREHLPCRAGWKTLLASLGKTEADDEPLSLLHILESNGLDDALWALRAIDDQPAVRLYAVRCVRQIQHLLHDPRSLAALDVAEQYAYGDATQGELIIARGAARGAAWDAAGAAAWDAAWDAVGVAALDAAWGAGRAATGVAAGVAAGAAALDAARAAALDAARAAQRQDFLALFCSPD